MKTIKAKIELYQQNGDKANYDSYKDKECRLSYDKNGGLYNSRAIKFPTCGKKYKGFNEIAKVKVTLENGVIYESYISSITLGTCEIQLIFGKGRLTINNP